jgi:hypothetical protein
MTEEDKIMDKTPDRIIEQMIDKIIEKVIKVVTMTQIIEGQESPHLRKEGEESPPPIIHQNVGIVVGNIL